MKKGKLKSIVKSARKEVKADIKLGLVKELKEITSKLGQESKKLSKQIEKGSEKLAKAIAKEIKIDKSALQQSAGKEVVPQPVQTETTKSPTMTKEKPLKKETGQA